MRRFSRSRTTAGVDLIERCAGRLAGCGIRLSNAAIGCAKFYSRPPDAVIRVRDYPFPNLMCNVAAETAEKLRIDFSSLATLPHRLTYAAEPRRSESVIRVPRLGALLIWNLPPKLLARSRILKRPNFWDLVSCASSEVGSNPGPLSATMMRTLSRRRCCIVMCTALPTALLHRI